MEHPITSKRKTKIVCTLGPASNTREKIKELLLAGMDLVRINCSHGEPEDRETLFNMVREVADEMDYHIPIMFDLQGPKIRLGKLTAPFKVNNGDKLEIAVGREPGSRELLYTTYPFFLKDIKAGEAVLIDDGKVRLRVDKIENERAFCTVEVGGEIKERKGINLPSTKISAPCISEKDQKDLEDAVRLGVDFVAVSFVRSAEDIKEVRRRADEAGEHHLHFIAKIERPEALKDLIDIVENTDGVMVARGDLGVEIGSHRVPLIQKEIIMRANMADKFVITATQMLESMIERPVPTRAEASDVANAILDGTDACMLSAETAAGDYPVEAVEMMSKIAVESESHSMYRAKMPSFGYRSIHHIPDGISVAAFQLANVMGARLLVAFTNSGGSALKLSKKHPDTFIVGATIHKHIARRMRAYWGVLPVLIKDPASIEEMFDEVKEKIRELSLARRGDVAVLTSGFPLWASGSTNLMKVIEVDWD